ncbi:MAG: YraN family protein [Lachnospiraceae bacterium]|nr:YraN family protein [Lachnospiraceae bacterium]
MNTRAIGAAYERKAAEYLQKNGYQILERNYRCRAGEIDLVARQGEYLVFAEVKYRRGPGRGSGLEAVDWRKQRRILRAASWYIREKRISPEHPCRFDVVSFRGDAVTLVQDAFQY